MDIRFAKASVPGMSPGKLLDVEDVDVLLGVVDVVVVELLVVVVVVDWFVTPPGEITGGKFSPIELNRPGEVCLSCSIPLCI